MAPPTRGTPKTEPDPGASFPRSGLLSLRPLSLAVRVRRSATGHAVTDALMDCRCPFGVGKRVEVFVKQVRLHEFVWSVCDEDEALLVPSLTDGVRCPLRGETWLNDDSPPSPR